MIEIIGDKNLEQFLKSSKEKLKKLSEYFQTIHQADHQTQLTIKIVSNEEIKSMKDLKKFELLILLLLAIPIIFFGFYPEPLINSIETSVTSLIDNYNTNLTQSIAKK